MTPSRTADIANRVDAEHAELRDALGAIHKRFGEGPAAAEWVGEKLALLAGQLAAHFQTEEEGGFFDQIVQCDPRFAPSAAELSGEHGQMLTELESLVSRVGSGEPTTWWDEARGQFHDFSRRLMRHESDETRLMQSAYWDDIGSKD